MEGVGITLSAVVLSHEVKLSRHLRGELDIQMRTLFGCCQSRYELISCGRKVGGGGVMSKQYCYDMFTRSA